MDAFYERLALRAATIDELLSEDFEPLPGQKGDAESAARRLAAWCRSCASGDWSLFGRRLERDGLSFEKVLSRLATVRRKASASPPVWLEDAMWIEAVLRRPLENAEPGRTAERATSCAFEHLFVPIVERAEQLLWADIVARVFDRLTEPARDCLRRALFESLSSLCAPAIYERFATVRKAGEAPADGQKPPRGLDTSRYDQFVAAMKAGGFRSLFEDKPVLLRLIATLTRQWIEASREFVLRLDADMATIGRTLLNSGGQSRLVRIDGDISDSHNGGRSVQILSFEDGSRIVYKPKDLRLDAAWFALVERLNAASPPIDLEAVRAIARDGYGWTEFIEHRGCADDDGCSRFFRRAGAWLALFHCFAASDMHQENMIATADYPVPIDLETLLQVSSEEAGTAEPERDASDLAMEKIANSVMMVGLLPAYGRGPDNRVFAMGGMTADWNHKSKIAWENVNSDAMRPAKAKEAGIPNPNLPHVAGRYAKLGDHIDEFVFGFEAYAKFLLRQKQEELFDGFAGIAVRKVVRLTRFYYMLLMRLRDHRSMEDGAAWSAQADFIARLAEWGRDIDPIWPLHRAERSALVTLNVPHFTTPSDGNEIRDAAGISIRSEAAPGLERARARLEGFDEREIAWQIEVIRANTNSIRRRSSAIASGSGGATCTHRTMVDASSSGIFGAEADKVAAELARHAIRSGRGAAWIGLDWLGDADVVQLVCLGPDLYNGVSGIALFLAAHAAVTGSKSSGELALAAVSRLRRDIKGRNAARQARALGVGGATGLGSIVYALTAMSKLLHDEELLADAHVAADLFTDDLIAADQTLDVVGGSAGAILGLLRLYRDGRSDDVLRHAAKCGEHLMAQSRIGPEGRRCWVGQGLGQRPLNGMSHGAAGFAYALASLASLTRRDDFATAAAECVAFEDSTYSAERHNWPDVRGGGEAGWPYQWCHGAPGIGLARIATAKRTRLEAANITADVRNAVEGVEQSWPGRVDTLCCGTLGSIEFLSEAGKALGRADLCELASQRLLAVVQSAASAGGYRWNSGQTRFNLGLFRGIAGVGYTSLRQVDGSLPNVLIWD